MKTTLFAVIVALTALFTTNLAFSELIPLESFEDFCNPNPPASRTIQMPTGSNLMFKDPDTGEVASVGLDGVSWHIGFVDEDNYFVGWAENPWVNYSGYEGWLEGSYTSDLKTFDSDGKPNFLRVVADNDGDGVIAWYNTSSGWTMFDEGDSIYTEKDVLFGPSQIRGDTSQLPSWNDPGFPLYLPEMTISPCGIMGDANCDGFVNDDDLSLLLSNWQMEAGWEHGEFNNVPPVDDDDLSFLLSNWTGQAPCEVSVPEPATFGLLVLGGVALLRRH